MAQGYVCKVENADVIFNYDSPFTCAELNSAGDPIWANSTNWCDAHSNADENSPPCTVVGCCERILGSDFEGSNPLQGILWFDTLTDTVTNNAYICCNGGTYETFGCLDPVAVNYDLNATYDPSATADNPYGGCIYPIDQNELKITADDGYNSYFETFKVDVVRWDENPYLQDITFSVDEDEDLTIDLEDGILAPTSDIAFCNWEKWWDCLEVYILANSDISNSNGYYQAVPGWDNGYPYPFRLPSPQDGGELQLCADSSTPPCKGNLYIDLQATNEPYTNSDIGIIPDTVKYRPFPNLYGSDYFYFIVVEYNLGFRFSLDTPKL